MNAMPMFTRSCRHCLLLPEFQGLGEVHPREAFAGLGRRRMPGQGAQPQKVLQAVDEGVPAVVAVASFEKTTQNFPSGRKREKTVEIPCPSSWQFNRKERWCNDSYFAWGSRGPWSLFICNVVKINESKRIR